MERNTKLDAYRIAYKELAKRSKLELLAQYSCLCRVHSLTERDSKQEIIWAILDITHPQ